MALTSATSAQFARAAHLVAERVCELLYAPVWVTNDRSVVITSSSGDGLRPGFAHRVGSLFEADDEALRVPLCVDRQIGEVVVGKPLNGEMISPRLARVLVELIINQAIVLDQSPNQHELKNQLIYDLLHAQIADEAAILSQAKQLGMDLTPPRAVILIDAADYVLNGVEQQGDDRPQFPMPQGIKFDIAPQPLRECRRRAQLVIGSVVSFFHLPNDTICADIGQGEVAVLKASDTKNLQYWADCPDGSSLSSSWANLTALRRAADALLLRLRNDTGAAINVGIGRYHPGLRGLSRSYQDARAALSLGTRFQGRNQVHCLGRLGIAAFVGVADERTKVELAKYLLSPLDHERELLMTLDGFFSEDCCPSATAKRLSIHRNTLSYRLDKIALLTGLDPRRFDDAVQMRLALLLRSLQPQSA